LRALHLHNNHLTTLPEEMLALKKLFVLVLAFNRFASIPPVVAAMTDIRHSEMDKLILAGNQVSTLSENILASMKYVKKLDLRLNLLTLLPSETARLALVERLTHLDIRDNCISEELDLRCLAQLSYLNCERNNIMSLQLTGSALKTLLAAQNST
jgi:PH domain/leucine-rich repeat-containing protein phosphatase